MQLADVTCNKIRFDLTITYGKYYALLDLKNPLQDIVAPSLLPVGANSMILARPGKLIILDSEHVLGLPKVSSFPTK